MTDVRVGDVGTTISLDMGINLSTSTLREIIYQKPSGVIGDWAGLVDPADAEKLQYVTLAGDIDEVGTWRLQVYIEMPTGKWHSTISLMPVLPTLR